MGEIREEQNVKLTFVTEDGPQELECQVCEVFGDRLSLTKPKEITHFYKYLREGDEVTMEIFAPAGVRKFNSMIIDGPLEKNFVLEFDEDSAAVQRRQFTCADFKTKIIIDRISGENIEASTIDISGGGIRFLSEQEFLPDQIINIRLFLPPQEVSLSATGKILDAKNLSLNEHVMVFTEISEMTRDKIIKKCFEIERQNYKSE